MKPEHVRIVQGAVALISGSLIIISLFLPWATAYITELDIDGDVNAFQLGEVFAHYVRVEIVTTLFNFLLLFGALVIIGAVLVIVDLRPGSILVRTGSILAIVFAILAILLISVIPALPPGYGPWLCLGASIAGAISPQIKPG